MTTPKYRQAYNSLKKDIYQGKYPAGTYLPRDPELAKTYGVSVLTMRSAVMMLQQEGVVEKRNALGCKVIAPMMKEIKEDHTFPLKFEFFPDGDHEVYSPGPIVEILKADEEVAAKLLVPKGTPVYRLKRVFWADGSPFGHVEHYLVKDLFPSLERVREERAGLYDLLWNRYRFPVTEMDEDIRVAYADEEDREHLGVPPGTMLLELSRVSRSDSKVFEIGRARFIPEKFNVRFFCAKGHHIRLL